MLPQSKSSRWPRHGLLSSRGVQQGDVCGPALFAICLHAVIVVRLRECGLVFTAWYLDAGILCRSIEAVKTTLEFLQQYLPGIGLELNLAKCKLFGPGAQADEPIFVGIPRIPMSEWTTVLGVPVGSDSNEEKAIDDVCEKLSTLLSKVALSKYSLAKFLLLRASFGAYRVNHLLRSVPFHHGPTLTRKSAILFRSALDDCQHEKVALESAILVMFLEQRSWRRILVLPARNRSCRRHF